MSDQPPFAGTGDAYVRHLAAQADRPSKLLQYTLLALAVQGYTSPAFWHGFDNNFDRVHQAQMGMRTDLQRLAKELWP